MRGTNVSIKCGCAQISASSVCTNVSDLQRICDTSKQLHRFSSVHRWSKDSRHRTTAQHRVPAQMPVTSNGCHTAASNPALCRHLQTILLYADISIKASLLYADISNQFCLRQTPPNNPACGRHLQCNKTGNFIQCRNWKRNTLLKSKTDSEASRPNNKSCFSVEISVQDMLSTKFTSLVLIKSKLSSRKLSSLKLRGDFTGCPWKVKKREDPDTWQHFFNKLFKQLLKSLWC